MTDIMCPDVSTICTDFASSIAKLLRNDKGQYGRCIGWRPWIDWWVEYVRHDTHLRRRISEP